ncbi:tetraacyldisaccharide 4'-kinase, partial [bacterium]|nr:tetraacyldisaccharide 4'-kinase [bacterium]
GLAGTGWRVVQARDRAACLAAAVVAGAAPRVVLLEDGHQTAGVGRHLDALILDRWQVAPGPDGPEVVPGTGPVFPFGPWREGAVGAARAGLWLVESGDEVPVRGRGGAQVLGFRRVGRLVTVGENAHLPARPVLVSGIARPERFEAEATGLLSAAPVLAVRLEDHASYGADVRARIVAAVREAGGDGVVTTAKDWVKLAGGWPADLAAAVVDLELVWGNDQTPADVVGGRLV